MANKTPRTVMSGRIQLTARLPIEQIAIIHRVTGYGKISDVLRYAVTVAAEKLVPDHNLWPGEEAASIDLALSGMCDSNTELMRIVERLEARATSNHESLCEMKQKANKRFSLMLDALGQGGIEKGE
ncbi:MAG: hypothetical protein RR609_06680 [Aurantimicrobium sp.]